MGRDLVNAICAAFPGAERSDPWGGGHDAWKVGGRMFACIGARTPGVSVKTPDPATARMLIDCGVAARAPYLHPSWVLLPLDSPEAELSHRIAVSYRLVRAGLPRRLREGLAPLDG
ncbi:MAG: MmcQ/YjbR family DNA-binding protein [Alphaproteobacteria bacterium]|nr:MAG: MmcQ/YjbR family DNA-binding protein [Alphaproteobacteria bacterium]